MLLFIERGNEHVETDAHRGKQTKKVEKHGHEIYGGNSPSKQKPVHVDDADASLHKHVPTGPITHSDWEWVFCLLCECTQTRTDHSYTVQIIFSQVWPLAAFEWAQRARNVQNWATDRKCSEQTFQFNISEGERRSCVLKSLAFDFTLKTECEDSEAKYDIELNANISMLKYSQ